MLETAYFIFLAIAMLAAFGIGWHTINENKEIKR